MNLLNIGGWTADKNDLWIGDGGTNRDIAKKLGVLQHNPVHAYLILCINMNSLYSVEFTHRKVL